jgi:transcriptional regulator with XRE-family HTH domain
MTTYLFDGDTEKAQKTFTLKKNIDQLVGKNLKRLRESRKWTQEELSNLAGNHSDGIVSLWEHGLKGIGKNAMSVLCNVFNVQPYEFYIDEDSPVARDEIERNMINMLRQAEKLDLREEIERYARFAIEEEQKKRQQIKTKE